MLIVRVSDTRVQILDEAVCDSLHDYDLEKSMDTYVFFPAMRKIVWQNGFFRLGEATSLGKGIF